ncbi:Re/Si-specific NAD(P)(+) transhydrogenase subunit alpha [Rhodospirillaceae bacterium]|jgi:NAD(P) transhydrogenase subunit alpha|nr:Re/Si-specific NAD(P)(+) transhydrogenase subunit alpha [Alphaproteobacteria bacterium]MDC1427228.1 Re/Si-specific NAD(P)(+) transhydrogenase subunit alpha [Rhodospirillaceae bacterium]|tara:strand:- start:2180 stop:3331 length:1152 start_codon:yes stop_codon:yes gene_type:complete
MQVGVIKEQRTGELRVAITPETVKKFVGMGLSVVIETKAGLTAAITDQSYKEAGANIVKTPDEALKNADIVLKVRKPIQSDGSGQNTEDEVKIMKAGAVLICLMEPYSSQELIKILAKQNITTFSMELIPRITRAQTMDTLSSQSNLAGYKAVLEAAHVFGRAFPMMMTAAGTVPPAKCLVMGAGVAGLQAIATARRLGAVVSASDVRPAAKENVESLGASFVAVEDEEFQQAETAGGYAKEMSDGYKEKQAELIASTVAKQDIVICTALIPGRPAPVLVTAEMVKTMRPGSVLVDLAAEQGGNCPLSVPDKTIIKNGVSIIGQTNLASAVAIDASILFAKNLLSFVSLMINQEDNQLVIDIADEIIKESLLTNNGEVIQAFT